MILTGALGWLRRRDPGYLTIRRGLRLTVVASLIFLGGRYGLDNPLLAVYGLFSALATGLLAQLPDEPRERARVLALSLLPALFLVCAGTALAINTWAAAAGMFIVGFVVSFAGVGGPRLSGLGPGLQLLYILPCFPPYAPQTLPTRLAGVTLGVVLLALAELVLWPDPAPVPYRRRLATAATAVAGYVEAIAAHLPDRDGARQELARRRAEAYHATEQMRLARLSPLQRPGSAGARDWALRDSVMALRELLEYADRLPSLPGAAPELPPEEVDAPGDTSVASFEVPATEAPAGRTGPQPAGPAVPDTAALLRQAAGLIRAAGRTLVGARPVVDLAELDATNTAIREIRAGAHPQRAERETEAEEEVRLCVDAIALQAAEHACTLAMAARISARLPVPLGDTQPRQHQRQFWYVRASAPGLYWKRFRDHLTLQSVYLQGAIRIALALAAARAIAGHLNLAHGFWVLLATLTLMRTSAADTRTTLRPAVQGTVLGAAAGAGLLLVTDRPEVYEATLPIAMVLTFAVGPLLGLAWSQGLITLLLTILFAQLGPADLQLIEARFVNVLIGAVVGVTAGLLFWPRGTGMEVRRTVASYLESGAAATQATVAVLMGRQAPGGELDRAHRAMGLANASVLQHESERHRTHASEDIDWLAALLAGHQMVHGGEARLQSTPPPRLPATDATDQLDDFARRLSSAYVDIARQFRAGRLTRPVPVPPPPADFLDRISALRRAGEPRPTVLNLLDVEVWLISLMTHLQQIQTPPPALTAPRSR